MPSERHEDLIDRLVERGWSRGKGWREAVREKVAEEPFCGLEGAEVLELTTCIDRLAANPDAYRLKVEGPAEGWGEPQILVIEVAEIVVTHDVPGDTLADYEAFWWACDASSYVHFRLYIVNRYAEMRCVLDLDPEPMFGRPE